MTLPSPLFTVNGGAPGAKASVSAGATVTCELDDITGVTYVEWSIITTDETTEPGDYTLSTTGGVVPGNETMTFTAGIAATGGLIKSRVNHGVNQQTGNAADEDGADPTVATAKWYVPTTAGLEVLVDEEVDESDATHGTTGIHNQAIRALSSGSAPGAFSYISLGAGTKPASGLVRAATGAALITTQTQAGGFDNAVLADDGADGIVVGNATRAAQIDIAVKTGGGVRVRVNGSTETTLDAAGINIASGNTYAVAGVGHATSAVASSLMFRGVSGEASLAYLYSSGGVATTGYIRLARNFTAIACKTSLGADHPILVEDNAEGFTWGSSTVTAGWITHVKTGGEWLFKVNNITEVTLNSAGINLATANEVRFNNQTILTGPSGVATLGSDASAANVDLRAGGPGESVRMLVNGSLVASANATGMDLASGLAYKINGVDIESITLDAGDWDPPTTTTKTLAIQRLGAAVAVLQGTRIG